MTCQWHKNHRADCSRLRPVPELCHAGLPQAAVRLAAARLAAELVAATPPRPRAARGCVARARTAATAKRASLTCFWMTSSMAAACAGALPSFFIRRLSKRWVGMANASRAASCWPRRVHYLTTPCVCVHIPVRPGALDSQGGCGVCWRCHGRCQCGAVALGAAAWPQQLQVQGQVRLAGKHVLRERRGRPAGAAAAVVSGPRAPEERWCRCRSWARLSGRTVEQELFTESKRLSERTSGGLCELSRGCWPSQE